MTWPKSGIKTRILLMAVFIVAWSAQVASSENMQKRSGGAQEPVRSAEIEEPPFVAALSDGTFLACYTRKGANGPEVVGRTSRDNGHTWGEPETLIQIPTDKGAFSLFLAFADRKNDVHLFFLNRPDPSTVRANERRLDIWHTKSLNGRKEWHPLRMVHQGFASHLNSVIQLKSGRIVVPFASLTKRTWSSRGTGFDAYTYMGQYDCTTIYSDDDGITWHRSPAALKVETPTIGHYGAVEPVILELKDGRVWMLMRTQRGRFWESFSDDGVVWSPARPTNIFSSDSPAGVVRLKDGRIALFWNACLRVSYAFGGRPVLHVAISEDEGKTWRGYREVVRDPKRHEPPPPSGDWGTAYPFPHATKDGKILLRTGQGVGRNFLLIVDPDWVYETRQKEDFSDGIEDWSTFGTRGVELVPHPAKAGAQALSIRKLDKDWAATAVWNFPMGPKGSLRMRMMLKPGFQGALIGLSDHYSVPFDYEDQFYNMYNFSIGPEGQLEKGGKLEPGRWYNLQIDWDTAKHEARVSADGRLLQVIPLLRDSFGVSYLRLRSMATLEDTAGFIVESVEADVSQSWKK